MDPLVSALGLLSLLLYLSLYRRGRAERHRASWPAWRLLCFGSGALVATLALQPPLAVLADDWFWAHMTQHMLLLVVAPPLLILGLPAKALLRALPAKLRRGLVRPLARRRGLHRAGAVLLHPATVFVLFNGALGFWHVPALYRLAEQAPALHIGEHASYLFAGCLLWWLIVEPLRVWPKDSDLAKLAFVVLCHLPMLLLGQLLLAFTAIPLYRLPEAASAATLSPLADQRLGGAIMFGLDMLVTFATVSTLFGRYLVRLEAQQREREAALNPVGPAGFGAGPTS